MKTILFYLFSIFLTIIFLIPKPSFAQDAPCNPIPNKICGQTASNGKDLTCDGAANPPTCETETSDIVIKIKDLGFLEK